MQYLVLGPVEVRDGDRQVPIGGPQQRRLLAVLLAEPGRVVGTDRLIDAVWPDGNAPEAAAHSVLTYVSRLRTALADGSIETRGAGYALDPGPGSVDAVEFESLVDEGRGAAPDIAIGLYSRALSLWRGPAFGSFAGEWWAIPAAARLEELRLVACEERAAALIAVGDGAAAIPDLQALTAANPVRERPVRLLAQALATTGRQVEALRHLRSFRKDLSEATGLEPTSELSALERAIAAGDASPASAGWPLRGYVMHELIGQGATGRVYVATQPGTGRRVAVKVIRPELADADAFVRRFDSEAQLLSRMEHPHVVPLYDYWREPGGAYLVFRLLRRSAAAALVTGGPWSLDHVGRLVEEIGGALVSAHAVGITHGDVRLSNVLLDDDARTYLIDFGLAVGTEPGAGRGDAAHTDVRDMALLISELLTGSPPSAARGPESAVRLQRLVGHPSIPAAVDDVLAEASDPHGGIATMAELVLAWRAAVGRPEGVASPVGAPPATSSARRMAARELEAATMSGANPYRGLRPFTEADAPWFFGRDRVVEELVAAVGARRFVAVAGPSGSGKSSVIHAGLVPRLRRDDGPLVVTMVPGARPVAALRHALSEVATRNVRAKGLVNEVLAVAATAPAGLVVIVDQFEECWTLAAPAERSELLEAFATLAATTCGPETRVVVAVRADLYHAPLQHPSLGLLVSAGTFPIPPLTPAELNEAIVAPAARLGVSFDEGVVAAMVAEAAAQPAALPMVQFALAELFDRRVDGWITAAAFNALGGLAGAIGRRAEDLYETFDDGQRVGVRELFARLVAPSATVVDARRRAPLGELTDGARSVLEPFVAARLLVADRDDVTREPIVEVAHESLLTGWPRLREWVDEDRQWLTQLQHLAGAARSWTDADRADGELYRGSRLEAIVEALPERRGELAPTELAFVEASTAQRDAALERERRSTRRLRRLLAVAAVALVVALVAGTVALVQRRTAQSSARAAGVEALVGRIAALRPTQRDVAALLAVEAFRLADTPRTRSVLLSTFTEDVGFLDTHQLPTSGDLWFGAVMPDGEHAFVTTRDHLVRPYDLDTGEVGASWPSMADGQMTYSLLAVGADGRSLIQVSDDQDRGGGDDVTIGVYDTTTGRLRFPAITDEQLIGNAAVSSDGTMLATSGGATETVSVFRMTDGVRLGRTTKPAPGDAGGDPWTTAGLAFVGPDTLAVGSAAGPVRLLHLPDLGEQSPVGAPPGTTNHLDLLADGQSLLGHGPGGIVRLDLQTGTQRWVDDTADCSQLAVVEPSGAFYCTDVFGRVFTYNLDDGRAIGSLDAQNGSVGSIWSARGGRELVLFGNEPSVTRWRLDGTGPITRRLAPGTSP